jgi:type II secretory pathway pseudopilin PulG
MNCKKKGHRPVICHNSKRLNANGQVASASATPELGATADFAEFQAFRQYQRQQQNQQQRHQQQQQQQSEECSQIREDFGKWQPFKSCNAITQAVSNANDFCRPAPPLFLNLKPVGKPTFRLQVLADTGATRSLISLSTTNKHGCEIRATTICLSAANGTKIDVSGTTSLQVVEKGQRVHTIVAVVSNNMDQTIVGWKDLMAMGIISSDWPAMPRQETEGRILAADKDEEEKELAPLRRSARVQERKERETAGMVNAILLTPTPTPTKTREDEKKKKKPLPVGREKEEEREGQQQPPTCSTGQLRLCSLATTKRLSGQVQPAVPMGLLQMLTGQFIFLLHPNNNPTLYMKLPEKNMIITIPSLIAAGIATAVPQEE